MPSLEHAAPTTVEGACSLLEEHGEGAAILSGGQSLLPKLRQRVSSVDVVVDINSIEGESYIERDANRLRVGCLVRHRDVATSSLVEETVPALADAAGSIGDVQVRNRGTLCGAVATAHPSGDPPTMATLLDADIVVTGPDSDRVIEAGSFFEGDGETALAATELISELRFRIPGDDAGVAYHKWTPAEGSYPVAAVGALVDLDNGTVTDAKLVTGALEGAPTVMPDAADELVGGPPTDDRLVEAATTLRENADPREDFEGSTEFKRELAATMAKDALDEATERARE